MYSISKSKALRITYHLVKICLQPRFSISFYKTSLVNLQSVQIIIFLFRRSLWNLLTNKIMVRISFWLLRDFVVYDSNTLFKKASITYIWCISFYYFYSRRIRNMQAWKIFNLGLNFLDNVCMNINQRRDFFQWSYEGQMIFKSWGKKLAI